MVAGTAKGATDRMIDKNGPGRWDFRHNVEHRADDKGWDSEALDNVGDETDGLMAERSIGDKQGQVNVGLLQLPSNCRGEFFFDL
jgi:hypothetical protein